MFDLKLFQKSVKKYDVLIDPSVKLDRSGYGSLKLDRITGGGRVKGKIIELYGWEASGKTILAMLSAGVVLNEGGVVVFVDMEHAFNPQYLQPLLVGSEAEVEQKLKNFIILQPDCGDDALNIVEAAINSYADLVIFDSVAAAIPRAELHGDVGDTKVGLQARMMGQALRKISPQASRNGTDVIFINQLREKIGVMFGNPETTTGGNAMKFYAYVRARVSRTKSNDLKDSKGIVVGHTIKVKVEKNKGGVPFQTVEIPYVYGKGVCPYDEVFDLCKADNIFEFKGSHVYYNTVKLGNGKADCISFLKDNPELLEELRAKIVA